MSNTACYVCAGRGWYYSGPSGDPLTEPPKVDCLACQVYDVICRIPTGHTGEDRLSLSDTGHEPDMRRVAKEIAALEEFDEDVVSAKLMSLGIRDDYDDVADACFDIAGLMTILVD